MTVVIFDDDAVQLQLLEIVLEDKGVDFFNWRNRKNDALPRKARAIICDWLVPISWEPEKRRLIEAAIESGLPTAIYTAGGVNANILSEAYQGASLELVEKDHGAVSIIAWLERNGIKG